MRSYIYLVCLATVLAYSADSHAHNNRGSVVEGVRWHGHEHSRDGNRVLHEAFGSRNIWGIRARHLDSYTANRDRVTANGYDEVLVTYSVRNNRRRRRDDRGTQPNIAIGIAHLFSKYRMHEVAIEHLDRSRSRVIDVNDIRGVLMTHSHDYGNVTFDERAIDLLSTEWQQRFPTGRNQRYRFRGRVVAVFSDNNHLVEVRSVRRGRGDRERLRDRPVVLVNGSHLERPQRDRRDRDRRRDRNVNSSNSLH